MLRRNLQWTGQHILILKRFAKPTIARLIDIECPLPDMRVTGRLQIERFNLKRPGRLDGLLLLIGRHDGHLDCFIAALFRIEICPAGQPAESQAVNGEELAQPILRQARHGCRARLQSSDTRFICLVLTIQIIDVLGQLLILFPQLNVGAQQGWCIPKTKAKKNIATDKIR